MVIVAATTDNNDLGAMETGHIPRKQSGTVHLTISLSTQRFVATVHVSRGGVL